MSLPQEFHYRLPRRVGGWRPGSHAGLGLGAGQEFAAHMSLYDWPDPRRLDLRASLRDPRGGWLVRVHRQRAGIAVHVVVDVSASMNFGEPRTKLDVAADFVEALGHSAFRVGDALGMVAFDAMPRDDLFMPPMRSRGMGSLMAAALRRCDSSSAGAGGLQDALLPLAGRQGLVFLVSDFHWPLERLGAALDVLAHACVVPMVVWDRSETEPPARDGLAFVHDAETGAARTLWMRPALRRQWHDAVADRRAELDHFFAARGLRAFHVGGGFDGEAMSRYFFEAIA
jgi:uncharacterized protein (DUF58 family)